MSRKAVFSLAFVLVLAASAAHAAEFPVYFESESLGNTKMGPLGNLGMKTTSKTWYLNEKTKRSEITMMVGAHSVNFVQITMNGFIYDINNVKKNIKKIPSPRQFRTTEVHSFTSQELKNAGFKLIGTKNLEGQDCELWGDDGKTVQNALKNDPKSQAEMNKLQSQMNSLDPHGPSLANQFKMVFWIRKSDGRQIRTENNGGSASATITYRKISSDPSLFNSSLWTLPAGYPVVEQTLPKSTPPKH